ncbi:hypothetical protein KP509_04G011400 [Ceratopteris richardii]|uniref:Uncharacterized protein n=1 Tax=Ceratopteris richardii TaxID=49495 RepID=A0A8T2V279_CERRI|nr:hypothetical protein KP509_04G011400 [Ceratopteris richardii]
MSHRSRGNARRVYGSAESSPRMGPESPLAAGAAAASGHELSFAMEVRSATTASSKAKSSSSAGRRKREGSRKGGSSVKSAIGGNGAFSSSESIISQSDYEKYDGFYEKRRGAMRVITGIFTCWPKSKDSQSGSFQGKSRQLVEAAGGSRVNGLTATALLEQAKAQQEALLETQDASDMWEWHMEQQQALASQEHEMLERTSSVCGGDHLSLPPILGVGGRTDDDEDRSAASPTGRDSPAWGWRRQEEIAGERVLQMFEAAMLRCRWEINTFCRVYMQQIVRVGYSLINTLMEMEPSAVFLKRVHSSYALEARINSALFRCFENDSFDESGLTHIFDPAARAAARLQEFARMRGMDPAEALRMHAPTYEPAFHAFAAAKSEEVLALLPAAALAFRSASQRDRFMDAFLRAAKWAWLLHRLATATTPPATILRVARGHPVDPVYVEAVAVPPIGSCPICPITSLPTVEFMIMPGFIAHRKVFRSRVYQHYMCKR